MTDLRDQLADFEAAARRLRVSRRRIRLTTDRELGTLLRDLRHQQRLTLDQVGARCHVTRKAVCSRELHNQAMAAGALVEHLAALGYDLVAVPRTTPDRRAA